MDNATEAASCRDVSNFLPRKWQNLSHRNKFNFGNWCLNHTRNRYLNILQNLLTHNTEVELTRKMSGIPTEVITGS